MKCCIRCFLYIIVFIACSSTHAGSYEDFFRAVNNDDAGTVRELLGRGFDPNAADEGGQVGLFLAMREGSTKVAAALLAYPGIQLDAINAAGETPLMMAALRGRLEWVRRLLEQGAQVNRAGWTPLHYAASGPQAQVVTLLLEQGAEVDAPSPNHTTALMMASRYGTEDSVQVLLARGASTTLRNDAGLNAAGFASLAGRASLAERLQPAGH
jgi:ankyrin repeat protein